MTCTHDLAEQDTSLADGGCPICLSEMTTYLQYKSDCWRNVSILLFEALTTADSKKIRNAKEKFEELKKMFGYEEV